MLNLSYIYKSPYFNHFPHTRSCVQKHNSNKNMYNIKLLLKLNFSVSLLLIHSSLKKAIEKECEKNFV